MNIDLTAPPATPEILTRRRDALLGERTRLRRRRKRLHGVEAFGFLGALAAAAFFYATHLGPPIPPAAAHVAYGAWLALVLLLLVPAAVIEGANSPAAAPILLLALGAPMPHDGLLPSVSLLTGAVVFGVARLIEVRSVDRALDICGTALDGLRPLDPAAGKAACEAFLRWCRADETLRVYQHRLVALPRRPTMAEYEAARAWAVRRDRQADEDAVKRACARLDEPV